jgi:hypothetical protein
MSVLDFIQNINLGNYLALYFLAFIGVLFNNMHKSTSNPINFTDLFLDKITGKMGGSEFRINTAFIVTSWALVFLTMHDKLTEWFLAAYIGAFVVDRIFSRKAQDEGTKSQ